MLVDALIVKHVRDDVEAGLLKYTLGEVSEWPCGIKLYDNTRENIGLAAARNRLIVSSSADVVILMDYDFRALDVDIEAMAEKALEPDVGVVVPGDGREGFYEPDRCGCNLMVVKTSLAMQDQSYFVAYADWDMLNRMKARGLSVLAHGPSTVDHVGSQKDSETRAIWDKDRECYAQRWGDARW